MQTSFLHFLKELEQFGVEHDSRTEKREERMRNVTFETGEFIAFLVKLTEAKRVLEIGTSNGFSTLWLADAVKTTGGKVDTVELSQMRAEMSLANFKKAGMNNFIHLHNMDAGSYLQNRETESCELLFLDSERVEYLSWWNDLQRVLLPGGLMIVDNAVSHAAELVPFIERVKSAPGYHCMQLSLGQGVFLALKAKREIMGTGE